MNEQYAIFAIIAAYLLPTIVALLAGRLVAFLLCICIIVATIALVPHPVGLGIGLIAQIVVVAVAIWANKLLKSLGRRGGRIPSVPRPPDF
jgi:hypothetical protein